MFGKKELTELDNSLDGKEEERGDKQGFRFQVWAIWRGWILLREGNWEVQGVAVLFWNSQH